MLSVTAAVPIIGRIATTTYESAGNNSDDEDYYYSISDDVTSTRPSATHDVSYYAPETVIHVPPASFLDWRDTSPRSGRQHKRSLRSHRTNTPTPYGRIRDRQESQIEPGLWAIVDASIATNKIS